MAQVKTKIGMAKVRTGTKGLAKDKISLVVTVDGPLSGQLTYDNFDVAFLFDDDDDNVLAEYGTYTETAKAEFLAMKLAAMLDDNYTYIEDWLAEEGYIEIVFTQQPKDGSKFTFDIDILVEGK